MGEDKSVRTGEVFVPGQLPIHTYNPRSERELEERLQTYLDDGGAILTLLGPTKTGKTVLLQEVLKQPPPVWVEAHGIKDDDTFWASVAHELQVFVDVNRSQESSDTSTVEVSGGLPAVVQGGGGFAKANVLGQSQSAVRLPSVEARKALERSRRVLVVDDFHFIAPDVQKSIIRAVKPLVHHGGRVIFAAISHRGHDVQRSVPDMVGRITPLTITDWDVSELVEVARRGFETLGVHDENLIIAETLAANSFGSPHVMQALCRSLVREVNRVRYAVRPAVDLKEPRDWADFFRTQVEGWAGERYRRLLHGPLRRGSKRTIYRLQDGLLVDGYGLALLAIASTGPALTIARADLDGAIASLIDGEGPNRSQMTRVLQHMTQIARRSLEDDVLPEDKLDELEHQPYVYSGVEPVLEYVDRDSRLSVADPYFAYFLRWGGRTLILEAQDSLRDGLAEQEAEREGP